MRRIFRRFRDFLRDECGAWFLLLLVAIAFQVIAYLLMPKPKQAKPEAAKDMEDPTADAGRPIPVIFGTVTVKGLNVLHFSDKAADSFSVDA